MTSKFGAHFTEGNDDTTLAFAVAEARISATRTLLRVDTQNPDALSTFDDLAAKATAQSGDPLLIALDEDISISTPAAARFVLSILDNWNCESIASFDLFEARLRAAWHPERTASGEFEAKLLDYTLAGLRALVVVAETDTIVPDSLVQAANNFTGLALELEKREDFATAFACALSATNLGTAVAPVHAEASSSFALSIARRIETEDTVAQLATNHAHLVAQIAEKDHSRRLDAFEAFENALWQLPSDHDARQSMAAVIQAWLTQEEYLRPLRPLLFLLFSPEERVGVPLELNDMVVELSPVSAHSLQEWVNRIQSIRDIYIEIENSRLDLTPQATRLGPHAVWSTWRVEHPQLLRAAPHGESILKEKFRDDILLSINHEVTHVYSMFGSIGFALVAMRWALLELELDLWTHIIQVSGQETSEGFIEAPAPLQEAKFPQPAASIVALAQAEQSVEVERKIQVLENTWQPWFEGIAVFGESGADPQMDPEWESPVESVIYNLWDRYQYARVQESGLSIDKVYAQDRTYSEALYGRAIQEVGAPRLNTYLVRNPRNYFPGYLAVRSVVSAWRSRLGKSIRGDEAFRMLLHMTRYSGFEAIPDLGLPLETFREAAVAKHMEWLRSIAAVSQEDLNSFLGRDTMWSGPNSKLRWVDGHLVEETAEIDEEEEQRSRQDIIDLVAQALSSLRGHRADAARVVGADPLCYRLIEHMAESIDLNGHSEPWLITSDNVPDLFHRLTVLPLGQAECPFWLLEQGRYLACLIRTREEDPQHGKPSYDLVLLPLEESKYSSLREQVLRKGTRRMTVTRIADLKQGLENRLPGMNLMVFQYGDWMHMQPRGVLFGSDDVETSLQEAVEDRLSPSPGVALQERLTGKEHPLSRRTAQWLEAEEWSSVDIGEGTSVDFDPWASRVRSVCDEVLSNSPEDVHTISRLLLEFVLGDPTKAARMEEGISTLYYEEPDTALKFISFLDKSARQPLEDSPDLEVMDQTVREILVPLMERTPNGWDMVVPAMGGRKGLLHDEHHSSS